MQKISPNIYGIDINKPKTELKNFILGDIFTTKLEQGLPKELDGVYLLAPYFGEYWNEYEKLFNKLNSNLKVGGITRDNYTKKQQEYESKLYELNLEGTKEIGRTTELHLTVESMFSLLNRLPEIFKSSNCDEKNKILKYLTSNSLQTGQKADINLKKPFLFLYQNQGVQGWQG